MNKSPDPLDKTRLTRAMLVGIVLAVGGIGLFFVIWQLTADAALNQFPRLMMAMCVPPAVIALIVGVYFLIVQPRR